MEGVTQKSQDGPLYNVHSPSPAMDIQVWGNLPDHILDKILLQLPYATLCCFRSVCKSWNTAILSPRFLQQYELQAPWFYLFPISSYSEGHVYYYSLNRWHYISLFEFLPDEKEYYPLATAAGLVVFISLVYSECLLVCNPLTGSFRELPPMLATVKPHTLGMVVDRELNTYRIVVLGAYNEWTGEVYDSLTQSWSIIYTPPPRGHNYSFDATPICKGILYSPAFYKPGRMAAYDMKKGVWSEIRAQVPEGFRVCGGLFQCQDQLYMMGGPRIRKQNNVFQSFSILMFDELTKEWTEIDRMPDQLYKELIRYGPHPTCVGSDDLMLLYAVKHQQVRLAVVYDLLKRRWRRLPRCSFPGDRFTAVGFHFEPNLRAVA